MAKFLKRVTPEVLEVLDEAYGSNAFDDYNPNVTEASSTNVEILKKINALRESDSQVCFFLIKLNNSILNSYTLFNVKHFIHKDQNK